MTTKQLTEIPEYLLESMSIMQAYFNQCKEKEIELGNSLQKLKIAEEQALIKIAQYEKAKFGIEDLLLCEIYNKACIKFSNKTCYGMEAITERLKKLTKEQWFGLCNGELLAITLLKTKEIYKNYLYETLYFKFRNAVIANIKCIRPDINID